LAGLVAMEARLVSREVEVTSPPSMHLSSSP
jgi:hypothetical protein